jgi:hypothetical protein
MKKENRIFVALYSEDEFCGISIPIKMQGIIEYIGAHCDDTIDEWFDDYDEYRDFEVEMSHYAKDGSAGTIDVESVDELKELFKRRKNVIEWIDRYVFNNRI